MQRRDFFRMGLTSAAAILIAPQVLAEAVKSAPGNGDLYYTKASPGRWAGKEATHVPNIELSKNAGKTAVKVITPHEMKAYEHYIVKHVLLDRNYKFIEEHMFNPTEDKIAQSTFTLSEYTGTLYVVSLCNKHDLWLTSVEV